MAVEAYAVLTRAPLPLRVTGAVADEYLRSKFAFPVVSLPAADYDRVLGVAAERKLVGGAIYDAIVAATARHAGATLLTLDRRATRTYEAIGVDYKLVA